MINSRIMAGAILIGLGISGCTAAPTADQITAKLEAATRTATQCPPTASIKITNQHEAPKRWIWSATVDGKPFECDVDNFFELPSCDAAALAGV